MKKLDILNRDAFVEQLLQLIEHISENKSSTCFALNGSWGCGKSFVLDLFEEQINLIKAQGTYTNKYFVVRYNSWRFDYYEEPLVAIVATIISEIEEKTKLFPDSQEKQEILGMLKATGMALLSMANTAVKDKTGLDLLTAFETVRKGEKDGAAAYESAHEYDAHFGFNKVLEKLSGLLQDLSQIYTIVILVDELDRCIPEYAIKVLERLHHLTDGIPNIITLIATDKEQLMSSVKQIFGFQNPGKYLEKFFNFEVQLDCGTVSEKISEKYSDYISLFDKDIFPFDESVEECLQILFHGIDIREQEQLMKRAALAHKLIYEGTKDYSFMCMEILLTIMICVHNDKSCIHNRTVRGSTIRDLFTISSTDQTPAFNQAFMEKLDSIGIKKGRVFSDEPICYTLPQKASLYGAIALTWYLMHQRNRQYTIQEPTVSAYQSISNNHTELKKFVETIYMIK